MNKKQKIPSLLLKISIFTFICYATLPIIVYVFWFGPDLSRNQQDWAAFGSYLGGIYTPTIALLTALILYKQYKLQKETWDIEQKQKTATLAKSEIEFTIGSIQTTLERYEHKDQLFIEFLVKNFKDLHESEHDLKTLEKLREPLDGEIMPLHLESIYFNWGIINVELEQLKKLATSPSEKKYFASAKLLIVRELGVSVTKSLDNFFRVQNKLSKKGFMFHFQPENIVFKGTDGETLTF